MFSELTEEDIILSIESDKEKPFTRKGLDYSIWYNGKKYPAKEIIDRHYELKDAKNPNPGFNTNNAQDRLLALGFPVVQNNLSSSTDFFSQKDLISFFKLVERKKYNSLNKTDRNIAKYLSEISWGKTSFWANQLKDENWDVVGKKSWNAQDKKFKQVYKGYTWFKLIPKNSKNRLVYFTVGLSWYTEKKLVYKLDIQRRDDYFDLEKTSFFDKRVIEFNLHKTVNFEDLPNYDWHKLVNESKSFLENNLELYNKIIYDLENLNPLKAARICWNTFGWTKPSGRAGKSLSNSSESEAGFTNDEWLFDLNSTYKGFCYARIEPINKSRNKLKGQKIDLLLFTYNQETSTLIWVGKILNVFIVDENESNIVYDSLEGQSWQQNRIEQLKKLDNVDSNLYRDLPKDNFYNMKFLPQDVEIFEENLLVPDGLFKLKRYILNDFDRDKEIRALSFQNDNFEPSTEQTPPKKIKRNYSAGTVEYDNIHKELQIELVEYLKITYPSAKISFENSREINNRMIDVVMCLDGRKIYYEIKSYPSLRTCVRIAVGQLIEYCFFSDKNRADKLVIVSQNKTTNDIDNFLNHLRATLNLKICYSQFNLKTKKLINDNVF
ncbi:hypothetical protein QQY79_15125 [Flavobacterium tructae]|uniref:hypothetical protein n=1 Tax=Flavobacterium tructae TaxID=1114873 RepID=UPI002551E129|nr:hypothetical protein [Flavobacterium tructae]MDL2143858.1 hypothetical protein [Flavobacterium tructae]